MFYVAAKGEGESYCLCNTENGRLKCCTKQEILDMVSQGENIFGVSNGVIYMVDDALAKEKAKFKLLHGIIYDISVESHNIVLNGESDLANTPYYVTALGSNFKYTGSPVVKIPETIFSLGNNSFRNCRDISALEFSKNLKEIGDYCFRGCSGIITLIFPDSLKVIHSRCFTYNSNLQNISLPNELEELGDKCFMCCTSLTSIKLPESIRKIGRDIFSGCDNLKDIYVSKSLFESVDNMAKHLGISVRKTKIHVY